MWTPSFSNKFTAPAFFSAALFNLLVPQFALLHPSENRTRLFFGRVKRSHGLEKTFLLCFCRSLRFVCVDAPVSGRRCASLVRG